VELLVLWAVIDALSLVVVEPLVEDVVKPLLLMVVEPPVEDVVKTLLLVVVGVDKETVLVVVVDGGLLATVVLLATKVVPGTMYPEASTQLPGA
jgi:hypothetical protein